MARRKTGTSPSGPEASDVERADGEARARVETPIRRVEKRDGREVAFDPHKIEAAIQAALDAAGEAEAGADEGFAREVAGVVELALRDRAARREPDDPSRFVPHIEEIQDLVERALMELGCPVAAKAYILYRDRRARIRAALRVHRADARVGPLRVREAEGVSLWSKGRIVAALVEEAELPGASAEEVAAAVERRVFASGLRRITTGLIRELVAGELLERGWTHALARQDVVGIARHDLRTLLQDGALAPWERQERVRAAEDGAPRASIGASVAGELLRRYTLEDVLPETVAELHRAGDLHVVDLASPERPVSIALDAELLSSGGSPASAAFSVVDGAAELARDVSRVLVLERPAAVLAPLVRSARGTSPRGLATWLAAVRAVARAAGIEIHLGSSGPRYASFTARLVEELGEMPARTGVPVLYLEGHEIEDLLRARPELSGVVDRLFATGRLLTTWSSEGESFAGPGCHRRHRERSALACGGAVALNLPRLARRAGPWREEIVQAGVAELVQASLEAARSLDRFQRSIAARGTGRSARLFTRTSFAIVPVGLREALLHLGQGEIDPDQGARLFGLLFEASGRFGLEGVSTVAPCPFFGATAAARFAWLDQRASLSEGGRQHRLFADDAGGAERAPYADGYALSPVRGEASGRAEAEALRTLPAGALAIADVATAYDASDEHPYLSAWRRFEVLRRSHAGELTLELFPTPPPESDTRRPTPLRPLA